MHTVTLDLHNDSTASSPTFWIFTPPANAATTAEHLLRVAENVQAGVLLFCQGAFTCTQKITVELGNGADFTLYGIIDGKKDFSYNLDLRIIHQGTRAKSHVFIRGVLNDKANARIKGTIHINKTASESQARFDGKIVLFHNEAQAVMRPELEIENQDVSASHAASVGHVSVDDLFYLQSRGLTVPQAQQLIAKGLLHDVVSRLPMERPKNLERLLKKI